MKHILLLLAMFVLSSCTKDDGIFLFRKIDLQIDARLPKDENGFYYFKLYSMTKQNLHRISGSLRLNGRVPGSRRTNDPFNFGYRDDAPLRVNWENNLYWYVKPGDTVFTTTKTYLNEFTGQWTQVQLPPVLAWKWELVPTINKYCYNDANGEINVVIAPLWSMRGDTMIVTAQCERVKKSIKIILK